MKTELEIRNKIKKHEQFIGELLDKQQSTGNITIIGNCQDNIDIHRIKIEQFLWVLND